jgi:hypothetical protein
VPSITTGSDMDARVGASPGIAKSSKKWCASMKFRRRPVRGREGLHAPAATPSRSGAQRGNTPAASGPKDLVPRRRGLLALVDPAGSTERLMLPRLSRLWTALEVLTMALQSPAVLDVDLRRCVRVSECWRYCWRSMQLCDTDGIVMPIAVDSHRGVGNCKPQLCKASEIPHCEVCDTDSGGSRTRVAHGRWAQSGKQRAWPTHSSGLSGDAFTIQAPSIEDLGCFQKQPQPREPKSAMRLFGVEQNAGLGLK